MVLPLLLVFLTAVSGWAQSASTGEVRGLVLDGSGAPVPGAHIRLSSVATGQTRALDSDSRGTFLIRSLTIGAYSLNVESPGFAIFRVSELQVSVGQISSQRIVLRPATLTESLEVNESVDSLQSAASNSSVALGNDRIEESPAAGRNYLNFVFTAPGFNPSNGANTARSAAATRNPANDSGFVFAGMRGRNNSISIDGVDNRDETTGSNRVAIGLEMVQEVRVAGTSMSPEFGGAAGGIVNVVTHSGTNIWHGDLTSFAQNERFNARNAESQSSRKPRARRYQPGTSLNGPYRRDRGFFSTAVEQAWEDTEEWSDTPSHFIPRAGAAPLLTRGLFHTRDIENYTSLKVNQILTPRNTLTLRYAYSRGRIEGDVQAGENFTDRSSRGSSRISDHSFVGDWLWVGNARVVNDLRGQVSRRETVLTPNSYGRMFEIPGLITIGEGYRLNQQRTEDHYELQNGLTIVAGRHVLGIGASLHQVRLNGRFSQRFNGLSIYPSYLDYLADRPGLSIQSKGDPNARLTTIPLGVYLQDRWQLHRGLTIETGFRLDRQKLPQPVPNSPLNFSPRLGIAWHPGGNSNWVFRAGAGFFYDRYPLGFLADAVLNADLTINGIGPYRYTAASRMDTTYSFKNTFGFERKIDKNTTLSLEANLVRGIHLARTRSFVLEQSAQSRYQGATLTLNRRAGEVTYLVSYTAGRTRDDASDFDENPLNPANTRLDWALSRQHQLHRIALSGLFDLGWKLTLAPNFSYGSGRPLNPLLPSDAYGTLAYPLSARPPGFGRNTLYTPTSRSVDLRFFKTIPVFRERAKWLVGVESFNLLNHTNYARVSAYLTGGGFTRTFEVLPARQVQFFANLEF